MESHRMGRAVPLMEIQSAIQRVPSILVDVVQYGRLLFRCWPCMLTISSNLAGVEILLSKFHLLCWSTQLTKPSHCGTGCISGCSGTPPTQPVGTAPRPDGKCGSVSLYHILQRIKANCY